MPYTPTPDALALLRHAIDVYGAKHQQIKAAEEYAEMSAAISRRVNGITDLDEVASELADTEVMREQLYLIYPHLKAMTDAQRSAKLHRLANMTGYDGPMNL